MDLRLPCRLWVLGGLGGRVVVQRQRDDEFAGVARRGSGDVVFQQARVALGLFAQAAFLVGGGLEEDVEVLAVAGDGEAFEALVVVAPVGLSAGETSLPAPLLM